MRPIYKEHKGVGGGGGGVYWPFAGLFFWGGGGVRWGGEGGRGHFEN